MDTVDARLGLRLGAGNGSLGHWKTIIGNTFTNFQENFPGFEYNSFACLVIATDGSAEGTNSPNLFVPEEKEPYGL